ncbi:MAG: hypothetical protein IJ275_00010 [Ruminococcus sp.]|nr:hypothetical protein [Ruminococcus sp.]
MFDFNLDGKIDAFDLALGCMMFDELEKQEQREQFEDNLCSSGIDPLDLEYMDDDEREDFLFENNIDADDFDF